MQELICNNSFTTAIRCGIQLALHDTASNRHRKVYLQVNATLLCSCSGDAPGLSSLVDVVSSHVMYLWYKRAKRSLAVLLSLARAHRVCAAAATTYKTETNWVNWVGDKLGLIGHYCLIASAMQNGAASNVTASAHPC